MRYSCLNVSVPDSDSSKLIPSCLKLVISFENLVSVVVIPGIAPLFSFNNLTNRGIVGLFKSQLSIEFVLDENCPIEQGLEILNTLDDLCLLK